MKWTWSIALVVACGGAAAPGPAPRPAAPVAAPREAPVPAPAPAPAPGLSPPLGVEDLAQPTGSTGELRGGGTAARTGDGPPPAAGDHGPGGRVSITDKQSFDETTLTPDAVISKIQTAYLAGLKRCYRNYLGKDPTARGKLSLKLTVNKTGRTIDTSATSFSNEVDACAAGQMASWRFAVPKDSDGEPTEASFRVVLTLVPD